MKSILKQNLLAAGTAFAVSFVAAPASAALLELSYTDPQGAPQKRSPDYVYINPVGGIAFSASAGLDRKVQVEIKSKTDETFVQVTTSRLLAASDRITIDGQEYYGATVAISNIPEGAYILATRILSNNGSVVEEETKALVVDSTPPSLSGDWDFYRGAWGGGDITGFDYLEQRTISFDGITDTGTWVSKVQFFAELPGSGIERRYLDASYDSTTGDAQLNKPTPAQYRNLFHTNRQDYTIGFRAYDRAGNYAETTRESGFNGSCGSHDISHVWDPQQLAWVGYTSGMTAYENPVKFRTRTPLSEHIETNGTGRFGYNFPIADQDATYVYRDMTAIKPKAATYFTFFTDTGYCNAIYMNSLNVTLADGVDSAPVYTGMKYRITGEEWVEYNRLRINTPYTIDAFEISAEVRGYEQKAILNRIGECTIPTGETSCTIPASYSKTTGNGYEPLAVWLDGMGARVHHSYFYSYWDMEPSEVKYATIDHGSKRVRTQVFDSQTTENHLLDLWWPRTREIKATNSSTGGETTISSTSTIKPNYQTWNDTYYLTGLSEGHYTLSFFVKDAFGNIVETDAGEFTQDSTPPAITITHSGAAVGTEVISIASLDDLAIRLTDAVDQAPSIVSINFSGGDQGDNINLGWRQDDSGYRLEYPIMFPSLDRGTEYLLSVRAKDAQYNESSKELRFSYDPARVQLSTGMDGEIVIPAVTMSFSLAAGGQAIETEPYVLADGSTISGAYSVYATLKDDSEMPLMVNGWLVNPGQTVEVVSAYDFGQTGGRLSLPLASAEDGLEGKADLLITTTAPNAPVLTMKVRTWAGGANLNTSGWTIRQVVDPVDIRALPAPGVPCRITTVEEEALNSNIMRDPICFLEWTEYPDGVIELGTDASRPSPTLGGQVVALGEHAISYAMYAYDANGVKVQIGSGTQILKVESAMGSTRFEPSEPLDDVKSVISVLYFNLEQVEGPVCRTTLDAEDAIKAGLNRESVCLVEWMQLPTGITQSQFAQSPLLNGRLSETGNYDIAWRVSRYSVNGDRIVTEETVAPMTVSDPAAPAITMINATELDSERGVFGIPISGGRLGTVSVTSPNASIEVRIARQGVEVDSASVTEQLIGDMTINRRILTPTASLWSMTPYSVRAWYSDLAHIEAQTTYYALALPEDNVGPVLEITDAGREFVSNETIGMRVRIDDSRKRTGYVASTMGEWSVRLLRKEGRDDYEPVTDWTVVTNGEKTLEVSISDVSNSSAKFMAEARINAPSTVTVPVDLIRESKEVSVQVLPAQAIDGNVSVRKTSGQAPFNVSAKFVAADRALQRSLGEVRWYESSDNGSSWTRVDTEGEARFAKRYPEGTYLLRADSVNKHSGETYRTSTLEILAYNRPNVTLEGPRNAFIGDEVTINALVVNRGRGASALNPDNYRFLWAENGSDTWVEGEPSVTKTLGTEGEIMVEVKVIPVGVSEEDSRAVSRARIVTDFKPMIAVKAKLIGPSLAEVGAVDTWKGLSKLPYPNMAHQMSGFFTLPNGSKVVGDELTYAPTDADLAEGSMQLTYTAFVAGYQAETQGSADKSVNTWKYVWPDFALIQNGGSEYAPTETTLTVVADSSLRRIEEIAYEWQLPSNIEGSQRVPNRMTLGINEAGDHTVVVVVTDARGNSQRIERTVTVLPPPVFEIEATERLSNNYMRAPLDVSYRPSVTGGHPNDRVSEYYYTVNGVAIEGVKRDRKITLPAGEHAIGISVLSQMGVTAQITRTVNVNPNVAPSCVVQARVSGETWYYSAVCDDPDGEVESYLWDLSGRQLVSGNPRISVVVPLGTQPPVVSVIATDDSGDTSESASWSN